MKNKKVLIIFVSICLFFVGATMVSADNLIHAFTGKYLGKVAGEEGAGYNTTGTPQELIGVIIQVALSFLGIIFLLLMIYGGYLWMTARGNEAQVEKAQNLIKAAIIGAIIVVGAYFITFFVIEQISNSTLETV